MDSKKKKAKKTVFVILAILMLAILLGTVMVFAADESIELVGEMVGIKSDFAAYLVEDTVRSSDKYVGDYQYTVYYDKNKGTALTGYKGTPVIIYTVNHPIERIGTDDNKTIIESMLSKGYVVIVLDYLNNEKAVSPAIDYSASLFRYNVAQGNVLTNKEYFPDGKYRENFLVPSGYNVLLNQVFWEIDKHSANGTFDKIVENWNSDFRATKGSKLVKWVHADGERKATQNDFDGNAPVWYNADGTKNEESGQYTYVRFTKAEVVTDCVNPDGSFIDMDLYLHIVYPTSPDNKVPVMALASSSGNPSSSPSGDTEEELRPQAAGFLYNGYAYAVFDYLWEPMGRNASWGYYDGAQGVSKDHMNYSLHIYNDKLVNTAAMRFIRYTSLNDNKEKKTYNFDIDNIGVYGNSKGGWHNFLGEEVIQSPLVKEGNYSSKEALEHAITLKLESFTSDRMYNGHHGETRYSALAPAFEADGITLSAGTVQPWLTYGGVEIVSGCKVTIPENGGSEADISEGHMPIFVTSNLSDYLNAHYGVTLRIYNICRELDIPLLHYELPIGHTFPIGQDVNHNVDVYDDLFRFVNFYLKKEAITVAYTTPANNAGNVGLTDKITVAFTGQASLSEVEKITVTAGENTASGSWESSFGGVVWTFIPDELLGGCEYTLTVPKGFAGTNGTPITEAYVATFITEQGARAETQTVAENTYTFIAPDFTFGNSFVFRFNVANDAANVAELYANGEGGELLGSVSLCGKGSYEIDISDYVAEHHGEELTVFLKARSDAGDLLVKEDALSGELASDITLNDTNSSFIIGADVNGVSALGAKLDKAYNYNYSKYYNNVTRILKYSKVTGTNAITKADVGRLYRFSIDVYDETERTFQIRLKGMTDKEGHQTIDYDWTFINYKTVKDGWTTYEFTYRVYEPKYGVISQGTTQYLELFASPDGDTAAPIYLKNLKVYEILTDIDVSGASVVEKREGDFDYASPASSAFAIYNGDSLVGEYSTWADALAAYTSGYTLKLQSDYTLTNADVSNKLSNFREVNISLGSHTLRCDNTKNSLLWFKATNTTPVEVNVNGGRILIGDTPLTSYEDSSVSGSGKSIRLNLTGVNIELDAYCGATSLISATKISSGITLESKISLTDCSLELPDSAKARDGAVIFSDADSIGLDLSYSVKGGSIYLTSNRWISILESANTVEFKKSSADKYTSLVMPASYTYALEGSYFSENGYVSYAPVSEENNLVTYEFAVSENATVYGVIPDEFANGEDYPFILFKNGDFISAHTSLLAASNAASDIMSAAGCEGEEAVILLRDNHTTTNTKAPEFGISRGTIIFDLGGHTLTRSKSAFVGETLREAYPTAYKTSIVFKNGRVETAGSQMFMVNNFYSVNSTKYYEFTFENVTFGSAAGATKLHQSVWLSSYINNNKATTINTKITLRDCIFDLETNRPDLTSTATLFTLGTYECVFDLVIEGGTVIGDGSKVKIASIDKYDTLTLAPNADGEYLKFVPCNGGAAPDISNFEFADGKYRTFTLDEASGEYILSEGGVETPYGTIGATYADAQTYPFVVFKYNSSSKKYEFKKALKTWNGATGWIDDYAKTANDDVVILVRRDYTNTSDGCHDDVLNKALGTVTFDLGGFTLTRGSTLFSFFAKSGYVDNVAQVIIKNGTLLATTGQIFCSQIGGSVDVTGKAFNIKVQDVTLGYAPGVASGSNMFWAVYTNKTYDAAAGESHPTKNVTLNVEFVNCTFDLETNKPSSGTPKLFVFKDDRSNNVMNHNVSFKGGKIISENLSGVTFQSLNSGKDIVTFGADDNGEYTKLVRSSTAKDASHHNKAYPMADGNGYFVEISDDGITSVYELTSLKTAYGTATATAKYLSAVDYPFFVFANGEFVSAEKIWADAMDAALELVDADSESGVTAQIVMRRDYDIYKAIDGSVNFNTAKGVVLLDLDGFGITTVDGYFIDVSIKNGSATFLDYTSRLVVKNGTLYNKRATLPCIGIGHSGTSPDGDKKTLSFTFENVTFKTDGYSVIRDWGHSATTGLNVDLVLDGCTYDFDYHNGDAVMFHFNSGNAKVVTNVELKGGKIIASPIGSYRLINNRSEDTVVFTKDGDGNYTVLVQPTKLTEVAPKDTFVNGSGLTLVFVEEKVDGNNTVYELVSKTPEVDFTPKSSITLGSELVYNVYVPVTDVLVSFTLDGVEYSDLAALSESIVTLDNGKDYYLIPVALNASEAARDIVLKVIISVNGNTYNGTFTMSVIKYAKKIIDSEGSAEVEKTLVKDVLAYVRAAYVYFDVAEGDTALAAIDALLGDYEREFSKLAGEANNESALLSGVMIILEDNPIIRFYLAEGRSKESYTFKYGSITLDYIGYGSEEIEGVTYNYVDVSLYAYQLVGAITYTDGQSSGTYHINSYYDFVTTDDEYKNNTNLITLVEKLYNYAKSAADYKKYSSENS